MLKALRLDLVLHDLDSVLYRSLKQMRILAKHDPSPEIGV
jgi:hypothetical protein